MYELKKDFRFETAHRLSKGYQGKCQNIHGHSWNGKMVIEANGLDQYDMAMDFGDMKQVYRPLIDFLDHAIMLHAGDAELIQLCQQMNWKAIVFEENPTSEVVAKFLFQQWAAAMPGHARLVEVRIDETCTSECVYRANGDDRPVVFKIVGA
jgi:6-pyruvoyltetrahydropterin/6-carboxytetrahydropterin synthase